MGLLRKAFRKTIRKATRPIRAEINGKKGERMVDSALNPLFFGKVDHRSISNLILVDEKGKSHQIDHVEIRQNGIFCIETKNFTGWVFGDEYSQNWTQTLRNGEKHQFFNPIKQNQSHCYQINKVIGKKYPVNSVIVMANDNADKIKVENVVNLRDLKKYLSRFDNGVMLTTQEMNDIHDKLLSAGRYISDKEHIENIKMNEKLIKHGVCPRCGGLLVVRKTKNGKFYGCSNYPKCKFTKKI